jgi:hypothetical protein
MATYGYARVSTIDQDLSLQRRTLKAAGCDVIQKKEGLRFVVTKLQHRPGNLLDQRQSQKNAPFRINARPRFFPRPSPAKIPAPQSKRAKPDLMALA